MHFELRLGSSKSEAVEDHDWNVGWNMRDLGNIQVQLCHVKGEKVEVGMGVFLFPLRSHS